MAFDYKKEYKEFYMPKNKPSIVTIPKMNYIAVRGSGDPNEEESEYKKSISLLYAIAFTIKMSYKGTYKIDGYTVIAEWILKQNNQDFDGIYEIKFNKNLECIYFKSWEMTDE